MKIYDCPYFNVVASITMMLDYRVGIIKYPKVYYFGNSIAPSILRRIIGPASRATIDRGVVVQVLAAIRGLGATSAFVRIGIVLGKQALQVSIYDIFRCSDAHYLALFQEHGSVAVCHNCICSVRNKNY